MNTQNALRSSQLGMLIGVLLVVSRFLGDFNERGMNSVNTVLIVAILCLTVHFVRRVSSVRYAHVWESRVTLFFAAAALFNLVSAAVQIIFGAAFLSSFVFSAFAVLLSLPVLLSLLALYLSFLYPQYRSARALSLASVGLSALYVVFRMGNDVVLPLISYVARKLINPRILSVTAWNKNISLIVLALVFSAMLSLFAELKALQPQTAAPSPGDGEADTDEAGAEETGDPDEAEIPDTEA